MRLISPAMWPLSSAQSKQPMGARSKPNCFGPSGTGQALSGVRSGLRGPGAGRQVTGGWGGALQQYLVDRGWIVFSVDGRGTPDRGKAFEDQIYQSMGGVEVADQNDWSCLA